MGMVNKRKNILTDQEHDAFAAFCLEHKACYDKLEGKEKHKGKTVALLFSAGGGIGTGVVVKCRNCKKKKEITDYDSW